MGEDDRYLGEGGCSPIIKRVDLKDKDDVAAAARNYKLGGYELPTGDESPAPRSLKIFRLRTGPEEKMDAKALGRDEVTIYKAMFEVNIMLAVK